MSWWQFDMEAFRRVSEQLTREAERASRRLRTFRVARESDLEPDDEEPIRTTAHVGRPVEEIEVP